jgi:G protein-coupled receptor kinase interacting protein 2
MTLVSKGANGIWEHALLDSSSKSGKHRKPKPHHPVHPNKYDFITAKYKQQLFVHRSGKEHDQLPTDDLSQQLHASVRTGNLETSLRLIALGAEVNYFHGERGNTPLHVAASAGQQLQVKFIK